LIGATATITTTLITRKSEQRKRHFEKRLELLQEAVLEVSKFGSSISTYWADVRNASYIRDTQGSITNEIQSQLDQQQEEVYRQFAELSSPRAKLSMIAEHSSRKALDDLRAICDSFFKIAPLSNSKCTPHHLDDIKSEINSRREAFYTAVGDAFNRKL
jgi:hypothetical protein